MQPFPFRTFDEIAAFGLEVEIGCTHCKRRPIGPIDLKDPRLAGRPFTRTRFVCSHEIKLWDASPARVCGGPGRIIINPPPHHYISPKRSIPHCTIQCPRCAPPWKVSQAAKHLSPWKEIFAARDDVRMRCPDIGCRTMLSIYWFGGDGVPFTDGWERRSITPPSPASDQ